MINILTLNYEQQNLIRFNSFFYVFRINTSMRRQFTIPYQTTNQELLCLSPKHQQAQNSRKIIQINEAIRSIMSIGKMQKMQLIAINNRCLFNYGKIKRAEWTNRKLKEQKHHFLPNVKDIRLDNRSPKNTPHNFDFENDETSKHIFKRKISKNQSLSPQQLKICDILIQQYICKLKKDDKLNKMTKEEVIMEACKQIHNEMEKLMSKSDQNNENTSKFDPLQSAHFISKKNSYSQQYAKKQRSITEANYNQDLNRINKNVEYLMKQRMQNQKLFLRRIKQIKRMSPHIHD